MPAKKSRKSSRGKRRYSRKSYKPKARKSRKSRRSYRKRRSPYTKRGFAARARGLGYGSTTVPKPPQPLGLPIVNPYNLPVTVKPGSMPAYSNVPADFMNKYRIKNVGDEYNHPDFRSLQLNSSQVMPKPALRSMWETGAKKNQPLLDARYCGKGTLALGTDRGVWESTGTTWKPCKGGAANCYNPSKICSFYGPNDVSNVAYGPVNNRAIAGGQGQDINAAIARRIAAGQDPFDLIEARNLRALALERQRDLGGHGYDY